MDLKAQIIHFCKKDKLLNVLKAINLKLKRNEISDKCNFKILAECIHILYKKRIVKFTEGSSCTGLKFTAVNKYNVIYIYIYFFSFFR